MRIGGSGKMKKVEKIAKVGIVYSDDEQQSAESRNLAHYFCGLLSASGYADMIMIPYNTKGPMVNLNKRRVMYIPPFKEKPLEVPASDVSYAHWNSLTECHLVIVTVNAPDSKSCGEKLGETLQNHKHIPVFSLQRGVRHGTVLSDGAEAKGLTTIEAVVGFSVVLDPKYSAYVSTVRDPAVMFCRLSKEEVKIADGPLRLLETMDLNITFRKVLTPFSWGVLIYENLYALNILTKGTLRDTLANSKYRMILALMIRENCKTLAAAARGGAWEPNILMISSMLSPKLFEMLLLFPTPFFNLIYYLLGLFPPQHIMSPGQQDIMEGRKTMTFAHLNELIDAGKRYQVPCPISEQVLKAIELVDTPEDATKPIVNYHNADLISPILQNLPTSFKSHDSIGEAYFWITRATAVLSIIALLIFLFHHD